MKKQDNEVTELRTLTDEELKLTAGGAGFDFMGMIQKAIPMIQKFIGPMMSGGAAPGGA